MYTVLRNFPEVPAGFVHLPYLPEEVAGLLRRAEEERGVNSRRPASLASMSLPMMLDAVRIILETTIATTRTEEMRERSLASAVAD
jgi:pyroglutamyl-peptidase